MALSFTGTGILRFDDFGSINNLGPLFNDNFTIENVYGLSSIGFYLSIPIGATVLFEVSFDGLNFVDTRLRSIDQDEYTNKSSSSGNFIGSISTARKFRCRVTMPGSSSGYIIGRMSSEVSTLEGIEQGNRPDSFGNTAVHKDFKFSTIQTNAIIWAPDTGKKFVITDILFSSDGANDIVIFDETNASGNIIYAARLTVNNALVTVDLKTPFVSQITNNGAKITTTTNTDVRGVLHGYEITA